MQPGAEKDDVTALAGPGHCWTNPVKRNIGLRICFVLKTQSLHCGGISSELWSDWSADSKHGWISDLGAERTSNDNKKPWSSLSIQLRDGATNQAERFLPAGHPGHVNFKLVSHPSCSTGCYLLELQNTAVLVEPGDDGHVDEWLGFCRRETR